MKDQRKSGETLDLLTIIESEETLAQRLKEHGCDIYEGGPYDTYGDRLGACIVRNGMQAVVIGRAPNGKPETYADCFQRLYGKALPKLAPKQTVGGQYDTRKTTAPRVLPVDSASDAAAPGRAVGGKADR